MNGKSVVLLRILHEGSPDQRDAPLGVDITLFFIVKKDVSFLQGEPAEQIATDADLAKFFEIAFDGSVIERISIRSLSTMQNLSDGSSAGGVMVIIVIERCRRWRLRYRGRKKGIRTWWTHGGRSILSR